MRFPNPIKLLKAKEAPPNSETKGAGALSRQMIIDQVFDALDVYPDTEKVLEENGITRDKLSLLESDEEIGTALETRLDALQGTPWRLEGPESEPYEWVWGEVERLYEEATRVFWSAVPFGFSVGEALWDEPAPRISIRTINQPNIGLFRFNQYNQAIFYHPTTGEQIILDNPARFFVTRRRPDWSHPYGRGLLPRLFVSWFFRHNLNNFWMSYLERFGEPLLVGKAATPAKLVEDLVALGFESIAVVGKDDDLKAVFSEGGNEFERAEQNLARRVQKVVLGQTLTSDVGSSGSYAAASVHNDVRKDKKEADIRLITPTMQRMVNALWTVNRFPGKPPTFVMGESQGVDAALVDQDTKLMAQGVRLSSAYFLRKYDYEEDEITVPEEAKPKKTSDEEAAKGDEANNLQATAMAAFESQQFTPAQKAVENAVAALEDSAALFGIPPADIMAAVKGAESFEDLQARLSELAGVVNPDGVEKLAMVGFASQVYGYVTAAKGER